MKEVYRNVSMSDIVLSPDFDGTDESIKRVLYKLGCDVDRPIDVVFCEHRSLAGKVVTCDYYMCFERQCKEWLNSGYASLEAICSYRGTYQIDVKKAEREL